MSNESITLGPAQHGKLGVYHCDVPIQGRVSVVGVPRFIEDGEDIVFEHVGITAKRRGSEYTFEKL